MVLDLFSGIGGFSLGLERAGMETVAFCEYDERCRKVLKKHWPDVPQYNDIRTLTAEKLKADGIENIHAICGGFPCQDVSFAGLGVGLDGERSGLWSEYKRLIGEIRPRVAIIENVTALLVRGLDRVLCDLASLGYDAEWHCIPASSVGAHHQRDRVWIIAYPNELANGQQYINAKAWNDIKNHNPAVANTDSQRGCSRAARFKNAEDARQSSGYSWHQREGMGIWDAEPDVGRVANGVPERTHRLKQLGNAVVPQIPEIIGRAIMETEA